MRLSLPDRSTACKPCMVLQPAALQDHAHRNTAHDREEDAMQHHGRDHEDATEVATDATHVATDDATDVAPPDETNEIPAPTQRECLVCDNVFDIPSKGIQKQKKTCSVTCRMALSRAHHHLPRERRGTNRKIPTASEAPWARNIDDVWAREGHPDA